VIGDQRDPERNALKAPSSKNSSVFFRLVAPARRLVARGREPLLSVQATHRSAHHRPRQRDCGLL
jgi:hypothetical protein